MVHVSCFFLNPSLFSIQRKTCRKGKKKQKTRSTSTNQVTQRSMQKWKLPKTFCQDSGSSERWRYQLPLPPNQPQEEQFATLNKKESYSDSPCLGKKCFIYQETHKGQPNSTLRSQLIESTFVQLFSSPEHHRSSLFWDDMKDLTIQNAWWQRKGGLLETTECKQSAWGQFQFQPLPGYLHR